MTESFFSQVYLKVQTYKMEFLIGISLSFPFFLFILFAFIRNDFLVLDPSYWVSVIAYNVAIVLGLWLAFSKRTFQLSPMILYYGIGLSFLILIIFRDIAFSGDITVGVIDASQLLWQGENPYVVEGVRHARSLELGGGFRYTTYPYLPVDLLTYALLLGSMNFVSSIIGGSVVPEYLPGFNAMGILLSNLLFLAISAFFISKILDAKLKQAVVLSMVLFIILIWNNVCLAQTLFFAGWYFHKQEQTNLTIVFWTLSMLSKYFTGIFIVAYIVEYLRKREIIESLIKSSIAAILTFMFLLPFGFMEVLNSTVFFYNTEERILDGSFGGSLVSELVLLLSLESIVWLFTIIGFACILMIAFIISDFYQRLIITSLCSLLVITGMSAQFFPMILFVFIMSKQVRFFDHQNTKNELKTLTHLS